MTPDDEGVIGAIIGAKIGKSATPILVPIMVFGVAAALWSFWLGPIVLKTIAHIFPLLVLLAVLSGLWVAGTIVHRFRQASPPPAGDPAPRAWYTGLVAVPLKISIGATVLFALLVQVGIENPWPPKTQPVPASAKPASPAAQH